MGSKSLQLYLTQRIVDRSQEAHLAALSTTIMVICFFDFIDKNNHTAGIVLTYPSGGICSYTTYENYKFTVSVVCDINRKEDPKFEIDTNSLVTPCHPKVIIHSDQGCPVLRINPLFEWMEKVKYVLGPLTGILGIYFTFGSLYFYKTTCYIIGLWSTPVFILGILYGICIPSSSPIWLVSVLICVATFIGLFVGYFSMKFTIVAKILAGFFFGFVIESAIYIYGLFRVEDFITVTIIFWVTLGALVLIGSLIGAYYFPMSFIINTSFVGSYLFYRGVGTFAGEFTNEFAIAREKQEGMYKEIAWHNYIYVTFILTMGIFGSIIQFYANGLRYYSKNDAENKGFSSI